MLGLVADIWGCVSDPLGCLADGASAVPNHWWFWIGLLLGLVLGAIFDWWALILIIAAAALTILPRKIETEQQLDLPFEDKQPAPRRPAKKRQTIFDLIKRKKS